MHLPSNKFINELHIFAVTRATWTRVIATTCACSTTSPSPTPSTTRPSICAGSWDRDRPWCLEDSRCSWCSNLTKRKAAGGSSWSTISCPVGHLILFYILFVENSCKMFELLIFYHNFG